MSTHQTSGKRWPWEAIGAIAGVIGVIFAIWVYWVQTNNTPSTQQSSPPLASHQTTSADAQAASPTPTEPPSHLFKDIVLHQHAAVDIDGATPVITPGLGGITGNDDIYHDASPVSSSRLYTPQGLYVYKDNSAKAYDACTAYLMDTTHTFDAYSTLDIGRSFCFRSSDGRLVLLKMTALDGTPGRYSSVTFDVRVWDK